MSSFVTTTTTTTTVNDVATIVAGSNERPCCYAEVLPRYVPNTM
ncbi:hypothetical protein HT594_00127 [Phenacoccus solenopsis nudivirus]|nr:hypothetical protein HT594_00127 [Phenacoccus solenopsis nudivirus]